jgi:N-methylhydantoinase B
LLREGDRVVLRSAGGGGYGDPLRRDPGTVAEDVRLGYVSRRVAEEIHGVILKPDGAVDRAASEAARQAIERRRTRLITTAVADCYREGATSKRRLCRMHPDDASGLRVQHGDIVEVDASRAAPFRAWVEIDAAIAPGTLPIDDKGLGMLRIAAGATVEVRLLRRRDADPRTGVLG